MTTINKKKYTKNQTIHNEPLTIINMTSKQQAEYKRQQKAASDKQ